MGLTPLAPGDPRRLGQYALFAEIGRGGMGRVLLGSAPDGRLVAVKQVHPQLVTDDGFRARFRREVDASARVAGVRTAAVVDADPDAPAPWLASVYVCGPSLHDVVAALGPLPAESTLRLAAGLAAALVEIDRAGLIHRDLKPSNVLLAADGARLIDFGIARAVEAADSGLTRAGWLVGSPGFMSPEQALGRPVGTASDVFSLGVVLVVASTGGNPFDGPSAPQTLYNIVYAEPDLTAVPPAVRPVVARCLAKDPAVRPTPAQLLTEIGALPHTAQPWPPAVHRMIDAERAELTRLATPSASADAGTVPPDLAAVGRTGPARGRAEVGAARYAQGRSRPTAPPAATLIDDRPAGTGGWPDPGAGPPAPRGRRRVGATVLAVLLLAALVVGMGGSTPRTGPARPPAATGRHRTPASPSPAPESPSPSPSPSPTPVTGAIIGYAGKCVDVTDGASDDGTPIQLYGCNGTAAQQWTVGTDGTVQALGKCLDVTDGATDNGTPVQLYGCNGTGAQQWQPDDGQLVNTASGRCLDVTGGVPDDGTPLEIWDCAGTDNQRWTLPG